MSVQEAPLSIQVQPTSVRYRVLGWFCSLSMITYIDRVCIMQVQGDMQRDLGISPQEFSWAFSMFALAYALLEVPTGWMGDRIGPRKVLTRIVLCWLLFTAMTGLVWGLVSLVVVRFLFGAGEAGAYPNIARAARNWFPFSERGRAQGLIWTFGRWGGAIAPALIIALAYPFTLAGLPGWRGAFILLGVLGVLWVIGFSFWFRDTPADHADVNEAERAWIEGRPLELQPLLSNELEDAVSAKPMTAQAEAPRPSVYSTIPSIARAPLSWAAMFSSPTLWLLSFMYFCSNAGWSFFITYVSPFLRQDLGLTGWELHLASGAPLLFGGMGCLLGGFLTDWGVRVLGRRWGRTLQGVIAYALGGGFFLVALALTETNIVLAFAFLCLASFIKDFAMPASWSTTIDIGHRYSGTVAGFMNTVGNLGTFVSAPVVAWLAILAGRDGQPNWSVSLYYYASMFFIAAVCWFFINPRRVIVYSPADHERMREEGAI